MSASSENVTSTPSTSSAAASPAKTFPARAKELASLVLEAASGLSSLASLRRCALRGSSSRMSRAAPGLGSIMSDEIWNGSAMRRFRSRLRRAIAARFTAADASSSSPALAVLDHLRAPVPQLATRHRFLLPTLTAQAYGSNQGGAAGRKGPVRRSLRGLLLPTLLATEAKHGTITRRHSRSRRGGPTLLQTLATARAGLTGRGLSPIWCEWFMGFPEDWTLPAVAPSATPSSPNKPKSSAA